LLIPSPNFPRASIWISAGKLLKSNFSPVVLQAPLAPEPPKQETKDPHEEMTKALPSGVNYAKCEGADCGHVKLKNPKQTTKYKACPHCKANMVPKNNDFCPNCGIEEESKKFEEWEDSDIEIEEEKEDE